MSLAPLSETPTVLITGIDSFTGRHLAEELASRNMRVVGTTHDSSRERDGVYAVDLLDDKRLSAIVEDCRPDYVVHLAAISFVAHSDINSIYQVNVLGTRNLLSALATLPQAPERVLLTSSANIYGNSTREIIDETVLPNPSNDYGVSKLAMEYMASLWADRLPIVITRPFNYTGIGQSERFLIPKIVSHFRRGEKRIELGNIEIERDFSDIRLVTDAYSRILLSNIREGVFNVCSDRTHSLKSIIAMMEKIAGYEIEVTVNPDFVRKNDVIRLGGSSGKLASAIGDLKKFEMFDTLTMMYRGH